MNGTLRVHPGGRGKLPPNILPPPPPQRERRQEEKEKVVWNVWYAHNYHFFSHGQPILQSDLRVEIPQRRPKDSTQVHQTFLESGYIIVDLL